MLDLFNDDFMAAQTFFFIQHRSATDSLELFSKIFFLGESFAKA
jgi:hypothetical protein